MIDGVVLWDFDYIDLGRIRMPSYTVPVTIKSLVFSEDPRAAAPHQRIHHHEHRHGHITTIMHRTGIITATIITITTTTISHHGRREPDTTTPAGGDRGAGGT